MQTLEACSKAACCYETPLLMCYILSQKLLRNKGVQKMRKHFLNSLQIVEGEVDFWRLLLPHLL